MKIKAYHKNARMTPRKVRRWRELVIGLTVQDAEAQLSFQYGKAVDVMRKVLRSAVANAKENHDIEENNLRVAAVEIDEGMRFKRSRPAWRGMAHPYAKRTAHVGIVLEEIKVKARAKARKKKTNIETLGMDEMIDQTAARESERTKSQPGGVGRSDPGVSSEMDAFQKVKMQQQGGNKKKQFRRKSV